MSQYSSGCASSSPAPDASPGCSNGTSVDSPESAALASSFGEAAHTIDATVEGGTPAAAVGDADDTVVTPEQVVDIALHTFATRGFKDTRLKAIASESGMSKRMIHYHFGDKRGLYVHAIQRAISHLRPTLDETTIEMTVPVEGMRTMAEAVYDQVTSHPLSARLLIMESQQNHASMGASGPFADQPTAMLQMERLLMLGQDSGAFRPGISVIDIYTVIIALTLMRPTYHAAYSNLYNVNLLSEANTRGMRRLAVDTVLSFLTSNMDSSDEISYLRPDAKGSDDTSGDPSAGEDVFSPSSLYDM